MRKPRFGTRPIARTMPLLLAAVAAATPAYAQDNNDEEDLEEITITGIRGSLQRSMDTKKKSRGIVDAINAEDMGKFPDTNLAESLQRITGVSIDRDNGEGKRVTVRGWGPEFNLVIMNGRQMPVSSLEQFSAPSSRSFDFANLASEAVSSVEVYKTGKAFTPTGGIGSTIAIKTTRPLEAPGMKMTIGAKGGFDTSRNDGTSFNPEFSGLYSITNDDNTIGFAVTGSYQKRKSSYNSFNAGYLGTWNPGDNDWGTQPPAEWGAAIAAPAASYATPLNAGYNMIDVDYERLNGQVTLQFKPTDNITATVDYTYSELTQRTARSTMSIWFTHYNAWWTGGSVSDYAVDGDVAGPNVYLENYAPGDLSDLSFGAGLTAPENKNNSIGFNVEWQVNDSLNIDFDFHHSTAKSRNNNNYGVSSDQGSASFSVQSQGIDFTGDMPVIMITQDNGSDNVRRARMQATGSAFRNSYMEMGITQAQLNGSWEFDSGIIDSIDFGASYSENKMDSGYALRQFDQYWGGVGSPDDFPDDMFTRTTVADKFDAFDASSNPDLWNSWILWDFEEMVSLVDGLVGTCGGNGICASEDWTSIRNVTEEQLSAYIQINTSFEMGDWTGNLVAGLRYEDTSVTSPAEVKIPSGVTVWGADNEAYVILSDQTEITNFEGGYDNFLPSIDFDISPTENMIFRASYSKTMTRPGYGSIQGGQDIGTLFRVGGGTASRGNPGLLPYESTNLDFSAEWYYGDASYASVGYFTKTVKNFIGQGSVTEALYGLPDPFNGALADAARAALGGDPSVGEIRQWIFDNASDSPYVDGTDIIGDPNSDPSIQFSVTYPVNIDEKQKVSGWEFALQHTFGESGFGFQANYTAVNTDTAYNDTGNVYAPQTFIPGISDTANLVGFYDKNGIQLRVAYNWRDKFLAYQVLGAGQGYPVYTEAYEQIDITASYEINDQWTVYAEGQNVTNSTVRQHSIHPQMVVFGAQNGPRYAIGARYKF